MKKILCFVSVLFVQFLFINVVNAKDLVNQYSCRYIDPKTADSYTLKYDVRGNKISVIDCSHKEQSCIGENYEHIVEGKAKLGQEQCLGSINIKQKNGKTITEFVPGYEGQYKYGKQWKCFYTRKYNNQTDYPIYVHIYQMNNKYYMLNMNYYNKSTFDVSKGIEQSGKVEIYQFKDITKKVTSIDTKGCPNIIYKYTGDNDPKKYSSNLEIIDVSKNGLKPSKNQGLATGHLKEYVENRSDAKSIGNQYVSCDDYLDKGACENHHDNISCVWISNSDNKGYCDSSNLVNVKNKVSCGNGEGEITQIPSKIPELTSYAMRLIQVIVPVLLIIMGSIDLFKGITSGKEDEIKKGQQMFIKRLVVAIIVFFIIVIVKFIISIIANTNKANIIDCIDCFVSNNCNKYTDTNTNKNTNTDQTKKYLNLFVGDSRTVDMCKDYALCEGSPYIAENRMGYEWFVSTAIPKINEKLESQKYNIVILLGVNNVEEGNKGHEVANKYYSKISSLANTTWKEQNIIFVSVNPISSKYTGKNQNSGVVSFNKQMKSRINSSNLSNLKYCDTYSKVDINKIDVGDGLHYNESGSKQIYNIIKNNCLK